VFKGTVLNGNFSTQYVDGAAEVCTNPLLAQLPWTATNNTRQSAFEEDLDIGVQVIQQLCVECLGTTI
jgi:hypothetical protein